MRAFLVVLLVCLAGFFCYRFFFVAGKIPENNTLIDVNVHKFELPKKELRALDGRVLTSETFLNKIVILNFWASWCAPCIEEVPSLIELSKKNNRIVILAFSGDKTIKDINAFIKSFPGFNKIPIYQVWDDNEEWIRKFNIIKLPESYVFNSKGKMVKRISGTINWNTSDSLSYFNSLE